MTQIKINYVTLKGSVGTAYVDEATGKGTDKHTQEPVAIEWPMARAIPAARALDVAEMIAERETLVAQIAEARRALGGYILQCTQDGGAVDPEIAKADNLLAALSHPIAPLAASDLSDEELLLAVDKHTDGKITDLELVEAAERWRHSARAVAALTTPEGQSK